MALHETHAYSLSPRRGALQMANSSNRLFTSKAGTTPQHELLTCPASSRGLPLLLLVLLLLQRCLPFPSWWVWSCSGVTTFLQNAPVTHHRLGVQES